MNTTRLSRELKESWLRMEAQAYSHKLPYHEHQLQMFSELHESEGAEQVRAIISKDEWDTDAHSFYDSLNKSKHQQMLTDYDVAALSKMQLFKIPGLDAGFALKPMDDGSGTDIVAVHNNSGIKGIGKDLMRAAIAKGGDHLDHFDGHLSDFYQSLGFKEYHRDPYDPQYDPDGALAKNYGEVDVIYRKL